MQRVIGEEIPEKEDKKLVFVREPKVVLEQKNSSVYETKLLVEKEVLTVLRPLFDLDEKTRLIFLGRHYFGMSIRKLARIFKLKKSRIYALLQDTQRSLG
jgi:DNA-directed RNA polymerase specialized sigma24 family protein